MKVLQESHGTAELQYQTQTSHEPLSDQQSNTPETHVLESGVTHVLESGPVPVSSNKSKKVTLQDIEKVQNLIEKCLHLYLNRDETANFLLSRASIEPSFTTLVWQKLEEENAEFFEAYYIRLVLKRQINMFNQLLFNQLNLITNSATLKVPLAAMPNGIGHMPVNDLPIEYHIPQQPPVSSASHPQIDSVGNMSSCHMVNGISAQGNFHPLPISSGMVMDTSVAGTKPVIRAGDIKHEVATSPASVASGGQYPYTSTEISELTVDASALDSTFSSNMATSEGLQLGPENGIGDSHILWNFSFPSLTGTELTNWDGEKFDEDYFDDFDPGLVHLPEEEMYRR